MTSKKGIVLWLTGLPCSGKTTLADELENHFQKERMPVQKLDGDLLRATISKDLGFSAADRHRQCERVAFMANLLSLHGVNVIVALVSPYRDLRAHIKEICNSMKEIYIKCSLEECKRRDAKGMYQKALAGEIKNFTGIHDVYEAPPNPDLIIDTENETIEACVLKAIRFLKACS